MADFVKLAPLDVGALTRGLSDFAQRQIPYATAQAVNTLAFRVRDAERDALDKNFTVAPAVREFVRQRINVAEKATKERLSALVAVVGKRHEILDRHEAGGVHAPPQPFGAFFIPSDFLRPTDTALPPRALYPANLRLAPRRKIEGGWMEERVLTKRARGKRGQLLKRRGGDVITDRHGNPILFGKRGTFLIRPADGRGGGIYQRTGPHRGDIQRLWLTAPRITLPARLHFEGTWRVIVVEQWADVFAEKLAYALRTAR